MSGELEKLEAAVREFRGSADFDFVDPKRFAAVVDGLQGDLCNLVYRAKQRGEHLLAGQTACGWTAQTCGLTPNVASDRLCVGKHLEAMPLVAEALSTGEIGYQATSVICHFRENLREDLRELCYEEQWIGHAKQLTVKNLHWLAEHVRYMLDPDSFDHGIEEDYEKRFLSISESSGMFHISGVLDREGGSALKTAIESLSKRIGTGDERTPKQRRADALVEVAHHAMNQGTLPRRNGVRPHITVHTTVEGLKRELGASASELQNGMPISSKTVQRLACDGTLARVLKAESQVVDVGRATRAVSPAQWRGLKARHRTCAAPGCDRPINWTSPHHIEFWSRGGKTNLSDLLPLCYFHHRLVHEGGWQVVRVGKGVKFIPPERVIPARVRGPDVRWAA
jgi:hypothetical protein